MKDWAELQKRYLCKAAAWLAEEGGPGATDAVTVLSLGAVCVSWRDALAAGVKSVILHQGARVQELRRVLQPCKNYVSLGDAVAKFVPRLAAMSSLEMRRSKAPNWLRPFRPEYEGPENEYSPCRRHLPMAPILTDQLALALGAHAPCLRVLRLSLATLALASGVACEQCGARSETQRLLRCSRCKIATYCDAACQRASWPAHKRDCARVAAGRLSRDALLVHRPALTAAGLVGLAACPLEELQLATVEQPWREGALQEDDWPVFLPHFTRLRRLNVSGVTSFADGGLTALASTVAPLLTHLDVADTAVSAAGIRAVIAAPGADGASPFVRLTSLRFGWMEEDGRRARRASAAHSPPQLTSGLPEELSEERARLLPALLRSLARSLVELVVQGEFFEKDAMHLVAECPHLRMVDLAFSSTSLDWDAPCAHVFDVNASYSLLALVRAAPPLVRHLRVLKLNEASNAMVGALAETCPELRELSVCADAEEVRQKYSHDVGQAAGHVCCVSVACKRVALLWRRPELDDPSSI